MTTLSEGKFKMTKLSEGKKIANNSVLYTSAISHSQKDNLTCNISAPVDDVKEITLVDIATMCTTC